MWAKLAVVVLGLFAAWLIYVYAIRKTQPSTTGTSTAEPPLVPSPTPTSGGQVSQERATVFELEDADLDKLLGSTDKAIVLFYAPWCGHCKRMMPKFADAAVMAANVPGGERCVWSQIDASKYANVAKQFDIEAFPTTIVFHRGTVAKKESGGQDEQQLVKMAGLV